MKTNRAFITTWLEDNGTAFPSQYGMVTHRQWLTLEQKRIPGSVIVEENGFIALRKRNQHSKRVSP